MKENRCYERIPSILLLFKCMLARLLIGNIIIQIENTKK